MGKISDAFYLQSDKVPNKQAIICGEKSLSYKDLAQEVSKCSNFLLSLGIKSGDHVGIALGNSIETAILFLSFNDIGITVVPLNPSLPESAVYQAEKSSKFTHFIANKFFFSKFKQLNSFCQNGVKVCIDGDMDGTVSFLNSDFRSNAFRPKINCPSDFIFILTMTSGSTGDPKPIAISDSTKYLRATSHIGYYDITPEDIIMLSTPLFHSLAERLLFMPLIIGATSVVMPVYSPLSWVNAIKQSAVSFTIAVSSQLKQIIKIIEQDHPNISSLKTVVSSSAPLDTETKSKLVLGLKCDFHEMYGTSEVSTVADIKFETNSSYKVSSIGIPLSWADIRILKNDKFINESNEIGEITVKSGLICSGYYLHDDLFASSFCGEYFKTGDLGYFDEDGYLYFSGRSKDTIISGGINVFPQDIESCVNEIDGIIDSAAFALPDELLGEIVALAVIVDESKAVTKDQILFKCLESLPNYSIPRKVYFLKEFPKNEMGKLVRRRLKDIVN